MSETINNVRDGRHGVIGSWIVDPLNYQTLGPEHIGRTVIYRAHGIAEAGTITSWRDGIVFAKYSRGDTAAGADSENLSLGVRTVEQCLSGSHTQTLKATRYGNAKEISPQLQDDETPSARTSRPCQGGTMRSWLSLDVCIRHVEQC